MLMVVLTALGGIACNRDSKGASSTAKAFLQAYYIDLDFEKAKQLSTDISHNAIIEHAQIISLNPYAKEETPNIVFKALDIDSKNAHTANFIYTCNRAERKLPLRKLNNRWLVDLQGNMVETSFAGTDFTELSSSTTNGFASASSGEIIYKKTQAEKRLE